METIKYKRAYLSKNKIIDRPGKYELEVSNDVSEKNLVMNEDGTAPRYIVGLRAIAEDKLPQVRETFKENEEVDIEQTNGLFMTANIWKTEGALLPAKGEVVDAIVDFVPARESDDLVLRVISIKVRPAQAAKKLDVSTFFAEEPATTTPAGSTLVHQ